MLDLTEPFRVPAHIGEVKLEVTTSPAIALNLVAGVMQRAPAKIGLRLAGGCAGMTAQERSSMLAYFQAELQGYVGLVSSGATRSITPEGLIEPMVTDVPAVIVASNPNMVLAIGTAPRTKKMKLVANSRLVFGENLFPNPGIHLLVLIQAADGGELTWYDELRPYLTLFDSFVQQAGWRFATIVWNGGGVTKAESLMAAQLGWQVFVVRDSGRAAEAIAKEHTLGTLHWEFEGQQVPLAAEHYQNITLVECSQPGGLRQALRTYNFM